MRDSITLYEAMAMLRTCDYTGQGCLQTQQRIKSDSILWAKQDAMITKISVKTTAAAAAPPERLNHGTWRTNT
jgi:hypothetical protein